MSSPTPQAPQAGTSTPSLHPGAYSRRRPSEFFLPDGRRILVALPEEFEALRRQHCEGPSPPASQIEVVVHGSDQHCDFLRETQRHHEAARLALRERHGDDVLDEWDRVGRQLDGVTAQLERLADHSSALRENFSKFGFDARLRVYGQEDARSSRAVSVAEKDGENSSFRDEVDWNDRSSEAVSLFKPPVVKQYFHRGLLWRSSRDSEVLSCELFFDLLFVGIIAINGDHVSEEPTGKELLRFIVTFCMSWRIWGDLTQQIEWFEMEDILSQVGGLFIFTCLLG